MGSRVGPVVRALASHQCGLGYIPTHCHMWVEFVVGFSSYSESISPGSLVSLLLEKPKFPNSNLIRIEYLHENHIHVGLMWLLLYTCML